MNNYYDYVFWNEENYIKNISDAYSRQFLLAAMLIPLLISLSLSIFTGYSTILLVVYSLTFYLYQGPLRLKNHWIPNIIINAFCMGFLIFAYPFLVQTSTITPEFIYFSILFFCYISFFEIAHQFEHFKMEDNYTIIEALGVKRSVIMSTALIILVPLSAGIILLNYNLSLHILILTSVISGFRAYRLRKILGNPEEFLYVRQSWHKFYTTFEGLFYVLILLII
jgi:1,4-dihydroxy-2-naphthoate octaprenyltransferase